MELAVDGGSGGDGAVFGIVWGVVATVMGGLLVSNYRGFTDWLVRQQSNRRRNTEHRAAQSLVMARVIGGLFAVLGPVFLVASVVSATRGHLDLLHRDPHFTTGAARYIYPAMTPLWLAQFWFPGRGWFLPAWRRPGRPARVLTVVGTVAVLVFAVLSYLGYESLSWPALLVAGASSMVVLRPFSRRPPKPGE
jgi:hypothetical protein